MERTRVTFIYLGTSTAFSGFVGELARSSKVFGEVQSAFVVATGRPLAAELNNLGVRTISVPGIDHRQRLSAVQNFSNARATLLAFLDAEQPDLVITLMPHVWSPILARAIKQRCAAYVTIVHDAVPHPGDPSGWLNPWLLWDGRLADSVVTLSRSVKDALTNGRGFPSQRIQNLFHPDLTSGASTASRQLLRGRPLRLLFYGRILAYKGLPLLVEAIELLRHRATSVTLGVAGAGNIASLSDRLAALGAEVINRELSAAETAELLRRYDVMVCSHIEASQSGVAAIAFGTSMPVVATPVGGLIEQVITGRTGILAANVTAHALADAIDQLMTSSDFYEQISRNLEETRHDRSMERFMRELISGSLSLNALVDR